MAKKRQLTEGCGYPIAEVAMGLELYRLACGFAASSPLSTVGKGNPAIRRLANTFELSEVSRRLIAIAVAVRSRLDLNSENYAAELDAEIGPVGVLTPDADIPYDPKPLTLREACNKLIHASIVDFQFINESCDEADGEGLLPRVLLHGTLRDKDWQAVIEVYDFIKGAHNLW
jgi:hypothetical protein